MTTPSAAKTIRKNDEGIRYTVTIMEPDPDLPGELRVKDVSTATVKKIHFDSPTSIATEETAVFVTDGVDGQLRFVGVNGNTKADEVGRWSMEGEVTIPTGTFRSSSDFYDVEDIIS